MIIQEIFEVLSDLGLVRSQVEFSRIWLGKSPRYYSSLLSRQQQPSLGTLAGLLFRVRNFAEHTMDPHDQAILVRLGERLETWVTLRIAIGRRA